MKKAVFMSAMAFALAACGGGGGDSGNSTTPPPTGNGNATPPTSTVVSTAGTLKTSAAAPSYAASSQQAGFFSALNAIRAGAGAGVVDQSKVIDVASQAHADYLTANITTTTDLHSEDSTKAGYYGDTVAARLTKAGYQYGFATEVVGGTGASLSATDCAYGLMDTVYHAAALLSQETAIGVGIGSDAAGIPLCVSDLADASTDTYGQVPASGALVAYPFAGQTNVLGTFHVAYEVPRPSATLFPNTTTGTPIIVRLRNADFVNAQAAGTLAATVTQFTLTDASGNSVPAAILAAPDVTGAGVTLNADSQLGDGFVILVPLSPLPANATYTARVSATLTAGGAALAKTWSFTTGSSS